MSTSDGFKAYIIKCGHAKKPKSITILVKP